MQDLEREYSTKFNAYVIEGSKGGEEKPHTPRETPNNLQSVAYAKVLVAVGEGELAGTPTGRDIYLNGTPLVGPSGEDNFGGVTWEWRNGTVDQSYIQGNPGVSNETTVNFPLKYVTPWVRQITKVSLSAVRVTLNFPALQRQLTNGDTVGYAINYSIDISTDGGPFVTYKDYTVSGKTNSAYERTHRVDLPRNPSSGWTIRVRRTTQDSTSSSIQDSMSVKSFTEVVDVKQRYPNTALLFVQFDSRLFGGGSIPAISVKVKGRVIRVPSNYDPETRTYSGVWAGDFKWAWTDNPAWVFFDIVTNERFGLGNRVNLNQVSKWDIYEVSQYCDVLVDDGKGAGTFEPRHTCNVYLQSETDAWQVLRDICSIFNGMTYWNGNEFIAIADKEESIDNIPTFSRADVVEGNFEHQSTDERSIYTSALVSYDEPTNHYGTQVEAVWEKAEILRWGGDRQTKLSAIGCTSRGEAQRKGKYNLLTNLYNRTVTFKTGLQGLSHKVQPGKIIGIADPLIAGKPFTGRLKSSTNTVVTLDRATEAKAGDRLFVALREGTQQARTISQVQGNVVTVGTAYSEVPMANAIWYLEASDLKSQLFKVTKLVHSGNGVYEITGVEYNQSKFGAIDNGARLESRPISKIPPAFLNPPSPINVTAASYIEQTLAVTTMTASWDAVQNAVMYEGQYKIGLGDWVTLGTTGAQEFSIRGIYTGEYVVRVRSINALGIKSLWGLSAATALQGKAGAPPSLASLTVTPLVYGQRLNWAFLPGSEDVARTEIYSSVTPSFSSATKLGDFAYPQITHDINGLAAGVTFYYWARLVDRTGNVGPFLPLSNLNGVMGQSSSDQALYEEYFREQIGESALYQELNGRIDLIDGPSTLQGSVNQRVDQATAELQEQIDAISDLTDSMPYDPTKTYTQDQAVLGSNGRLYQATQNVPVSTPPPNVTYWLDIGQVVRTENGTAARVSTVETKVTNIEGVQTAQATQITGLTAALDGKASVTSLNSLSATVTQQGTTITSQGTAITGLTNRMTNAEGVNVAQGTAINNLDTKVTNIDGVVTATSSRLDSLTSSFRDEDGEGELADAIRGWDSVAAIATESLTRATENEAFAQQTIALTATVQDNTAKITSVETVVATNQAATASSINQLSVKVDNNTAAVQVVSSAQATTDEKIAASYSVKLQVNSQGQYVAAGIGLGIENGPAGLQSTFLVQADKFAVVNGTDTNLSVPFVVSNGQAFIREAFIQDASITNAKIGGALQSTDYVPGLTGWILPKTGPWEMNGYAPGQGRMTMSNGSIRFYHPNGVLGIDLSI